MGFLYIIIYIGLFFRVGIEEARVAVYHTLYSLDSPSKLLDEVFELLGGVLGCILHEISPADAFQSADFLHLLIGVFRTMLIYLVVDVVEALRNGGPVIIRIVFAVLLEVFT